MALIGEDLMRQLFRFFLSPATFVNQLQWSRNHTFILFAFLGVAFLESQVGVGRSLNLQLSWLLSNSTGIARDHALIAVIAGRVAFLFFGALSLGETLWWVGAKFGRQTSRRVLNRRLAVVLTVMLGSYTLYAIPEALAQYGAAILLAWGLLLTYFTLREQFALTHFSAAVAGLVAVVFVMASWKVSDSIVKETASYAVADQLAHAKRNH
jgi:hypothetical protein